MKKILIISTGDINGAFEAAYRIAKFAKEAGFEVTLLVKHRTRNDDFVVEAINKINLFTKIKRLAAKVFKKIGFLKPSTPETNFEYLFLDENEKASLFSGKRLLSQISFTPDLVISGMTNGFINTRTLNEIKERTNAKIFMLLADMAPLTGGCHYAWDCTGYQLECKNCPAIVGKGAKGWPHENLIIKQKNIINSDIKVIGMSEWTLMQAKKSYLFKHQEIFFNINSCIDTKIFNNRNRNVAKAIFGLPDECKLIFTGSQNLKDRRKGVRYLIEALEILWQKSDSQTKDNTYILVAGRDSNDLLDFARKVPFQKHFIDYIKDYRLLSLAYQASDVFVCSSIEDSGPMMVSEALACGTPVVGFDMGVTYNMLKNGRNGFKVELKNSADLADGIGKILSLSKAEFKSYSMNAIDEVEKKSSADVVISTLKTILKD